MLWISEHTSLPFASDSYEIIWSVPGDLSFEICINHFLLKGTYLGINGSAVCISVCLTLFTQYVLVIDRNDNIQDISQNYNSM